VWNHRRHANRPPDPPGRARLFPRAGPHRGPGVPRRPQLPPGKRIPADTGRAPTVRVAVVAEFYPRAADPVLGIWAHRQALAVRDAGAELTVFVLHRLVPPTADFSPRALRSLL